MRRCHEPGPDINSSKVAELQESRRLEIAGRGPCTDVTSQGPGINSSKVAELKESRGLEIAGRGPCADVTSQGPGINSSKVAELRESRGLEIAGRGPCADVTSQGPGINSSKVAELKESRGLEIAGRGLCANVTSQGPDINSSKVAELQESRGLEIADRGSCADVTSQGPDINSSKVAELKESRGLEIAGQGPCADVLSQRPSITSSESVELREYGQLHMAGQGLCTDVACQGPDVKSKCMKHKEYGESNIAVQGPSNDAGAIARREIPHIVGVYIEGMVHGIDTNMTVDTGATNTMMSYVTYLHIPESRRPVLNRCGLPAAADGRPMETYGSVIFELEMGPLIIEKKIMVSKLEDEVLIRADILQFDPEGPADLILSQNVMFLSHKCIPVLQIGTTDRIRKVRAADHYAIPPMEGTTCDTRLLVEPSMPLAEEYSAVVAPCLVDASDLCTIKVRIMNPTSGAISVKQDMVLGGVYPIEDEPVVLLKEEIENGGGDMSHLRRIGETIEDVQARNFLSKIDEVVVPQHLVETARTA